MHVEFAAWFACIVGAGMIGQWLWLLMFGAIIVVGIIAISIVTSLPRNLSRGNCYE
jgi:hypothetical protein